MGILRKEGGVGTPGSGGGMGTPGAGGYGYCDDRLGGGDSGLHGGG